MIWKLALTYIPDPKTNYYYTRVGGIFSIGGGLSQGSCLQGVSPVTSDACRTASVSEMGHQQTAEHVHCESLTNEHFTSLQLTNCRVSWRYDVIVNQLYRLIG